MNHAAPIPAAPATSAQEPAARPTEERVRRLLAQLCTTPAAEIRPDDRLRADLGFDSVASMELLGLLSDEFGIDVDLEESVGVERVSEVVALCERHLGRV